MAECRAAHSYEILSYDLRDSGRGWKRDASVVSEPTNSLDSVLRASIGRSIHVTHVPTRTTQTFNAGGIMDFGCSTSQYLDGAEHSPPNAGRAGRFQLLSLADLAAFPDPAWLIEGILPESSLAVMYGMPATGKSFLSLDFALHVATGSSWNARAVKRGAVVYVAAEGAIGYKPRVEAWESAHAVHPDDTYFVTEAVQLHEEGDVDLLLTRIEEGEVRPALIVLDTLSRCSVGVDENSHAAMSSVIGAAERLQRETGATVLLVHHSRKDDTTERGSGALKAGVDAVMSVKRTKEGVITLSCTKMKNGPEFDPVHFRLAEAASSCIVEPMTAPASTPRLSGNRRKVLDLISESTSSSYSELLAAAKDAGVPKASFDKTLRWLTENEFISKNDTSGRYLRIA